MKLARLLKIRQVGSFVQGIHLHVVMALVSISFIGATSLTLFSGLVLVPDNLKPKSSKRSGQKATVSIAEQPLSKNGIEIIKKRNIFNSEGTLGDDEPVEVDETPRTNLGAVSKSKLPLKLLGVIFAGTPDAGLAMIRNTKKQRVASYLAGDTVMPKVVLKEIYETRVVVENNSRAEYIEIERKELVRSKRDKKKTPAKSSGSKLSPIATGPVADSFKEDGFERKGHTITITEQYKENLLGAQMSRVLQDAKAEPNMVNNELLGFRLTRIRENSIYQKVGFQSGDIVREINGIPLTDASGAIRLLQSLRKENEVEVRVQRGSDFFNMDVSIQ